VPVGVALITQLQVEAVGSVGNAAALVATNNRYELAPLTAVQLKVGDWLTPVAPFEGVKSVGAGRLPETVTLIGPGGFGSIL